MSARRNECKHARCGVSVIVNLLVIEQLDLINWNSSEYEVVAAPGQIVDYEVKDTKGHTLSKKDDVSRGKFSFTSEVFDVYELCFKSRVQNSKRCLFWILNANL